MRRALRFLLALAGAAGLAACVTPYELPRNVEAAKLNVKAVPAPRICVYGQWKSCVTRVYREVSTSTNPAGLAFVDSLDRGANCGP
jgi:hypothetical protein